MKGHKEPSIKKVSPSTCPFVSHADDPAQKIVLSEVHFLFRMILNVGPQVDHNCLCKSIKMYFRFKLESKTNMVWNINFSLCICAFCQFSEGIIKSPESEIIGVYWFADKHSIYIKLDACLSWLRVYNIDIQELTDFNAHVSEFKFGMGKRHFYLYIYETEVKIGYMSNCFRTEAEHSQIWRKQLIYN